MWPEPVLGAVQVEKQSSHFFHGQGRKGRIQAVRQTNVKRPQSQLQVNDSFLRQVVLEDAGSRMAQLATNLLVRDRVVEVEEYVRNVRAVTVEDVQRVLATVLGGDRARSVVRPR